MPSIAPQVGAASSFYDFFIAKLEATAYIFLCSRSLKYFFSARAPYAATGVRFGFSGLSDSSIVIERFATTAWTAMLSHYGEALPSTEYRVRP